MSRKSRPRYISAIFTSSQILPPNHRSRLNATKEAISDSHPLLYLIQNYDKYTSGNRIAIFRASINNWANLTLSGKAIKPFETFVSITFNLNQRIAGHVQMKVILGKDKWWWGSRCLTARWCFVGIWGKFLSLSPPHYIIGTPFNLTQMLIHWNLLLLHTGLNLTDAVHCSVLFCKKWLEAIWFNICHWFHRSIAPVTITLTSNFTDRCFLFSHLFLRSLSPPTTLPTYEPQTSQTVDFNCQFFFSLFFKSISNHHQWRFKKKEIIKKDIIITMGRQGASKGPTTRRPKRPGGPWWELKLTVASPLSTIQIHKYKWKYTTHKIQIQK